MTGINKSIYFAVFSLVSTFFFCELGTSAQKLYENGLKESSNGKIKAAYTYFKKAAAKEPKNSHYQWAAANTAPNQNDMFVHTKAAWDNGLKNPYVLIQLAMVSFSTSLDQRTNYAFSLYKDLPDTVKNEELRGDIYFQLNKPDSSLSIWKSIESKNPSSKLSYKIAVCYEKLGDYTTMLSYLEQCRLKNLLNSDGFTKLMSLWALQYDYARADTIYNAAVEKNIADDGLHIEYASLLISQQKMNGARELLSGMVNSKYTVPAFRERIFVMLAFIYASDRKAQELNDLAVTASKDSVISTKINDLCKFFLISDTNKLATLEKCRSIYNRMPREPYVILTFARELAQTGKFAQADSLYQRLPQVILSSPKVLTEFAFIKTKLGMDEVAIKLISRLHEHKLFSKLTLELFRDLSFKRKLFEKSAAAQKLLEQRFKDDVKIQWQGAILALNQGKTDSAITLFSNLSQKYPKEETFEVMRINALLIKGSYQQVLQECDSSPLRSTSKATISALKARALRKLQKNSEACLAFEEAIAGAKNNKIEITSEYAEFLLEIGEQKKAASLFWGLVTSIEKNPSKDTVALAMLLNNFAWSAIESGSKDDKTIIEAAKKANALQPQNINITDTYAMVLLKTGGYKECINLLQDHNSLKKEPRILVHLGQAYEKKGDKNRAVRNYLQALAIPDSTGQLPLQINRVKLTEHVKTLQEKE
jgi:predicted Zn-dependent protease